MFTLAHVSDLHVSGFGDTLHDRARLVQAERARRRHERDAVRDLLGRGVVARPARAPQEGARSCSSIPTATPIPSPARARAGAARPGRAGRGQGVPPRGAPLGHAGGGHRRARARSRPMLETTPAQREPAVPPRRARASTERTSTRSSSRATAPTTATAGSSSPPRSASGTSAGACSSSRATTISIAFPIASSARPRPTEESKRARWREFAARCGLELEPCGAWKRVFDGGRGGRRGTRLVRAPAAGVLPAERRHRPGAARVAARARGDGSLAATHAIASSSSTTTWCPLPHGVGKRAPTEIGMRLDDARAFTDTLADVGATLVMHGHRHISERRSPAGHDFELLAAPSLTLGCKSGDAPSFWQGRARRPRPRDAGAHPGRGRRAGERPGHRPASSGVTPRFRSRTRRSDQKTRTGRALNCRRPRP